MPPLIRMVSKKASGTMQAGVGRGFVPCAGGVAVGPQSQRPLGFGTPPERIFASYTCGYQRLPGPPHRQVGSCLWMLVGTKLLSWITSGIPTRSGRSPELTRPASKLSVMMNPEAIPAYALSLVMPIAWSWYQTNRALCWLG